MDHTDGPSRERLLERWLEELPVLVARLEQVHLPDGFSLDYSPASSAALERALLAEPGGPDADFVRAAAAYLGEILMDACGGRWDIDAESRPDPVRAIRSFAPTRPWDSRRCPSPS
ncbi:hypothetical protein ACQ4WX_04880 [Streptomyces lasalocidi]